MFTVTGIFAKGGRPHERGTRRKGQRVELDRIAVGSSLKVRYLDGSGTLVTSPVEVFTVNEDGTLPDVVIVQTRNSIYQFERSESE